MPPSISDPTSLGVGSRKGLSRRDYIIVPCLVVSTLLLLLGSAEILARIFWPEHYDEHTCVIPGPFETRIPKPNCNVRTKIAEGPWVNYHYNECGFRTFDSCGVKPPRTLRIVFLGSSYTQGYHVPFEQTYAELTTRALSETLGIPAQNENAGFEGMSYTQIYRNLDRIIGLQPDLVIWGVSPFDIEEQVDPELLARRNDPSFAPTRRPATFELSLLKRIAMTLQESRTVCVGEHYLFENTDTYVRLSWSRGDKTDYLRDTLSPRWQARFQDFNLVMADAAAKLKRAGIPLILLTIPSHQIGALLATKQPPPHSDPFAFGHELGKIARSVDIGYVDGTKAFSTVPGSDHLFYLYESHVNSAGNEVLAKALVEKCLDGSAPFAKLAINVAMSR